MDADEPVRKCPGTEFMTKLSEQLRYFVNKKITEDANWREVQVVLSGHEVPGEGEHKIMEYIRLSKAQPDYNPNVRHCLYGLDADLIMLGLLSHDPHFCLLREEVKFGPAAKKRNNSGCVCICFFFCYWLTVDRDMEGWSLSISTFCICRSCASTWISSLWMCVRTTFTCTGANAFAPICPDCSTSPVSCRFS